MVHCRALIHHEVLTICPCIHQPGTSHPHCKFPKHRTKDQCPEPPRALQGQHAPNALWPVTSCTVVSGRRITSIVSVQRISRARLGDMLFWKPQRLIGSLPAVLKNSLCHSKAQQDKASCCRMCTSSRLSNRHLLFSYWLPILTQKPCHRCPHRRSPSPAPDNRPSDLPFFSPSSVRRCASWAVPSPSFQEGCCCHFGSVSAFCSPCINSGFALLILSTYSVVCFLFLQPQGCPSPDWCPTKSWSVSTFPVVESPLSICHAPDLVF